MSELYRDGDWVETYDLDLGDGHYLHWTCQSLYEERDGLLYATEPDTRGPIGGVVYHRKAQADAGLVGVWREFCLGSITFDVPHLHAAFRTRPLWTVNSLDPLDLSPSLLCACGDHGFIRSGHWVRA